VYSHGQLRVDERDEKKRGEQKGWAGGSAKCNPTPVNGLGKSSSIPFPINPYPDKQLLQTRIFRASDSCLAAACPRQLSPVGFWENN